MQISSFRQRLRAGCLAERIDVVEMSTRTPLDVAQCPNLSALVPLSALGRIVPVDYGITPGSGPGRAARYCQASARW